MNVCYSDEDWNYKQSSRTFYREIQKPISTLSISVGNKVKSWVLLSDCNFLELWDLPLLNLTFCNV